MPIPPAWPVVRPSRGPPGVVNFLTVTLSLSGLGAGGFNGDIYVLLMHDGASSVLLNRPGRDGVNPFGYADNGMSVTFSDNAPNGDIHQYQSSTNPGGGLLTGTWAPDGRRADPAAVTTGSPRTAFLSDFRGLSDTGDWVLFVADLSAGGDMELQSWSLSIALVPEVTPSALATASGLLAFAAWRRLRQRRCRAASMP